MAAFVGADRQRPVDFGQHVVRAGGKWLFHQLHAQAQQMRREIGIDLRRPAFVRIDDEGGIRRARADGLEPRHVLGGAELDLQKRASRAAPPPRACCRACRATGYRPCHGLGRGSPRQAATPALAIALRLPVPKRAIDRVSRGTGWQRVLQVLPGNPLG
jgi:hypothetical protein